MSDRRSFDRRLRSFCCNRDRDRHLVKRLPDDREIQQSQSQKRDLFCDLGRHQYFYKFFKNLQKNAKILHFGNEQ